MGLMRPESLRAPLCQSGAGPKPSGDEEPWGLSRASTSAAALPVPSRGVRTLLSLGWRWEMSGPVLDLMPCFGHLVPLGPWLPASVPLLTPSPVTYGHLLP